MAQKKRIALGLGAAALALGAGLGVAGVASAATTPSPSSSASAAAAGGAGERGGHHGRGGVDRGDRLENLAARLAAKLGVEEAKVAGAFQSFRDANKSATRPADGSRPDRDAVESALAKSLAGSLGLDEAKVATALDEVRTEARAEATAARAGALKAKLDAAVADGTLTQAEADAVTKAAEKGIIGGGRR